METTQSSPEKRIVDQLNFGAKTAKRVTWEAWEFTVSSNSVEVVNASYGSEKGDHAYVVAVENRAGVPVPTKCECPADEYSERYACKHRVALATVGGPTVLDAAMSYPSGPSASSRKNTGKLDSLQTDGGALAIREDPETCPNGNERCPGPESEDLPCFPCFELSEGR